MKFNILLIGFVLIAFLSDSCLKENPNDANSQIAVDASISILNLEKIPSKISYFNGGKDNDSVTRYGNLKVLSLSNGDSLTLKLVFNSDSSLVTIRMIAKKTIERQIEIIIIKKRAYKLEQISDTAIALEFLNTSDKINLGYLSSTVIELANYDGNDNLEKEKDANLNSWYLRNTSESFTISESAFYRVEELAKKLATKYNPNIAQTLLRAGSWQNYFYYTSPDEITDIEANYKSPIPYFVKIFSKSPTFYKGSTLDARLAIGSYLHDWLVDNQWILP